MTTKDTAVIVSIPAFTKQIFPLIKRVEGITITDEKTKGEAATELNDLTNYLKKVTAYKEAKTKPLNQALKVIRDETRELEGDLKTAIDSTRAKLNVYQTNETKRLQAEQDAIASRVAPGKGHLSPETATKKIAELDAPSVTVEAGVGSVKFRTVRRLNVTDEKKIVNWLNENEQHLLTFKDADVLDLLKAGKQIPGAEIEEVQEAASYR